MRRKSPETATLLAENQRLRKEVAALKRRVVELEAQLEQNSSNSSRPPSSDAHGKGRSRKKQGNKKKGRRKRGGQPGHRKHERPLVPLDQVKNVVVVKPEVCVNCNSRLIGDDPEPCRHQVWEIPKITADVTEYQQHSLPCACGAVTKAALPIGVPAGAFGPRAMGFIALLTGRFRLSKREASELCSEGLGLPICAGSISKVEQTVSQSIAAPVEQARGFVQEQSQVNIDETGWKQAKDRAWLWVAATNLVTVFVISLSRGADVAKAILGNSWHGIVNSDRWSAYSWLPLHLRQICWAHLLRDFQGMVDRKGGGGRIGRELLAQTLLMFKWWHKVRDGTMTREQFKKRMRKVRAEVGRLLRCGEKCRNAKTAGMCKQILKVEAALWTFVDQEGIEPTNNNGEQKIRPAVLWRKGSFGTQSDRGSRFVERILTVSATCRQQNRSILGFLTDACEAQLSGHNPPSLLPQERITNREAA